MHPRRVSLVAPRLILALLGSGTIGVVAAQADNLVPLSINPLMVNNDGGDGQTNWGGFRSFEYGGMLVTESPAGEYSGFVIDHNIVDDPGTVQGSGMGVTFTENGDYSDSPFNYAFNTQVLGVNAADFAILDRASFGTNFDPDEYMLEVEYKPLAGNVATFFNVNIVQDDGFRPDPAAADVAGQTGKRTGEQLQWQFADIINYHTANVQPNGFATMRMDLTDAMGMSTQNGGNIDPFLFQNGDGPWQTNNVLRGDNLPDYDAFQNLVPNGAVQIHLQAPFSEDFDQDRLHLEVRGVRVVRRTPHATEVGRLDAKSGIGRRFGTQFTNQDATGADMAPVLYDWDGNGAVGPTEFAVWRPIAQLQRFDQNGFTNLILNTDDPGQGTGGFGTWQDPDVQTFDGTQATLNFRARLTEALTPQHANSINVVINDLDGNDTVAGTGGEEYSYSIDLTQLNTSSMTTISIGLEDFDARNQAFELVNSGDMLLTDFNLYHIGLILPQGAGLYDLEIESITITVPPQGQPGDFDGDSDVDGRDLLAWQRQLGGPGSADADNSGTVDQADLEIWEDNFGTGAATAAVGAVPEASSLVLACSMALAGVGWLRRRAL